MSKSNGKNGQNLEKPGPSNGNGKEKTRVDWERNHALIMDAYLALYEQKGKPPTQQEVADVCKLSRQTVWMHASEIKITDVMPEIKMRTQRVLHGLTERAEKGYAPEVQLWLQLVHGWVPTIGINHNFKYEQPKSELKTRISKILAGEALEVASNN